jgi:hypothetical protein
MKKEQKLLCEEIINLYTTNEINALIDYRRLRNEEPFLNKSEEITLEQSKEIIKGFVD